MIWSSPLLAPAALALAAVGGATVAWLTVPSAILSPEEAVECYAIVWVMQRVGYERSEAGDIIPVDHRPDLTARGDAITAALAVDERRWSRDEAEAHRAFRDTWATDAVWARVESEVWAHGRLEPLATGCERKLGLRL
jgi:hypothetical protein